MTKTVIDELKQGLLLNVQALQATLNNRLVQIRLRDGALVLVGSYALVLLCWLPFLYILALLNIVSLSDSVSWLLNRSLVSSKSDLSMCRNVPLL